MWVSYLSHYCLAVTSQLPAKTLPPLLVRSLLCMSGKNLKIFANSQQQPLLFSSDSALIPLYFLDLLYILYFTSPSLSQLRSDYSFTAPVNLLTFYPRSFSQTRTKYFSIISTETFRLKYFLVFRNIFYWDFMLCIKLWRENWWSCFLSIQCFSFFTPRNKHEKQVVLPLLSCRTSPSLSLSPVWRSAWQHFCACCSLSSFA